MLLSGLVGLAWWLPNRPQLTDLPMPSARLNSVSLAPYRPGESPLTGTFPTRAEVDQDLVLIATRAAAIRTYAAIEGDYDLPALARAHGLKMWQGIWLGPDRAANARELAAGIALARKNPDVIERVVVGNEVLLRRDLPVDELIADIDQVKRAVTQPVTYADVWNFFVDNPQVVPHLDVVTIHILPYWEDRPTNIDGVIAHVHDVLATMRAHFPASRLAIGETGWPSRGRWRRDAAPGLVHEATYLRRFVALAQAERLDYNFFQSFDEVWKYRNEGVVGASWGLWTADRRPKFPLDGPVREDAAWPVPAALSIACGLLLYAMATTRQGMAVRPRMMLAGVAIALGAALGVAWQGTHAVLFDTYVRTAAAGNLAGQAMLACLYMRRLARFYATGRCAMPRTGREATASARALLHGRRPTGWAARRGRMRRSTIFASRSSGPRPFCSCCWSTTRATGTFRCRRSRFPSRSRCCACAGATGGVATADARNGWRAACWPLARWSARSREGPFNVQSLVWSGCAMILALPALWAALPRRGLTAGSAPGGVR